MSIRVSTEIDASKAVSGAATTKRALKDVDVAMAATEKRNNQMKASFQNVGYQVSDMAVQLQGGVNPIIAITQQGGAMVQAFNPIAGAVFTIAGALGGAFLSSLGQSKDAAKELATQMEIVDAILTTSADGMFTVSEDVLRLANMNVQLADSYLRVSKAAAEAAQVQSAQRLGEVLKDTTKNTWGLTEALTGVNRPTEEQSKLVYGLSEAWLKLEQGQQLSTEETVKFLDTLDKVNPATAEAKRRVLDLRGAVAEYSLSQSETNQVIETASQGYEALSRSSRNTANASRELIAAKKEENELMEMSAFMQKEIEAEQGRRGKLGEQVGRIEFDTLSPADKTRQQEEEKLLVLNEYAQLGAEQERHAQELRTAVTAQYAGQRSDLERAAQNNTISAIGGGFDAMSQLSSQFIGEQDNQNKTAFALSKGFAVASAGLNMWLAISQAMADPSALTLPQKIANYATIAAAAGGVVSSISSTNYATGGYVDGTGTGTSDSVSANLSRGEFVVRETVARRNRGALESLNATGEMPNTGQQITEGLSRGGYAGGNSSSRKGVSSSDSSSVSSTGAPIVNVTVQNNTPATVTTSQNDNGDLIVTINEQINKRVPTMIGSEISNPNSKASRSLRSNYQMTRS